MDIGYSCYFAILQFGQLDQSIIVGLEGDYVHFFVDAVLVAMPGLGYVVAGDGLQVKLIPHELVGVVGVFPKYLLQEANKDLLVFLHLGSLLLSPVVLNFYILIRHCFLVAVQTIY